MAVIRKARVIAAAAVGIVALGAIPLSASPALAAPVAPNFFTPLSGGVSTADDGDNTSIHLLVAADPAASTVDFEYSSPSLNLGIPMSIGSAAKANGVFSLDWTPSLIDEANFLLVGGPIDITATPDQGAPTTITVDPTGGRTAVDIGNPAGSAQGVFIEPYDGLSASWMVVRGTTDSTLPVDLTVYGTASATPLPGIVSAPVEGADAIKTFTAAVNINGASGSRVIVNAATTDTDASSDDAEVLTPYTQVITSVEAHAVTPGVAPGDTSRAIVTVLDQKGAPVYGAHVWCEDAATHTLIASGSTGVDGTKAFAGLAGSAVGRTYNFTVDTTSQTDTYEPGTDFQRSATVTEYVQMVSSIAITSSLGKAVDLDETTALAAHLLDQIGNPVKDKSLEYRWTQTAPDGTKGSPGATTTLADGNGDGIFEIPDPGFTAGKWLLEVWQENDGTAGPTPGDLLAPDFRIVAGDASFVLDGVDPIQARAGTSVNVTGRLLISGDGPAIDGTPLVDRLASGAFTAAVGGDADLTSANPASTGSDGSFHFTVTDPVASPQQAETGGVLDVSDASAIYGPGQIHVDFPLSVTAAKITVTPGAKLIDNEATPGRPMNFGIHVANADGDPLSGVDVVVGTDHGFFTPLAADEASLTPASDPVQGQLYGMWKSLGTRIVVTTNGSGDATVTLDVERDAGFDDDGKVTATVTALAGKAVGDAAGEFTSADPLNGSSLDMPLAPRQKIRSLPHIRTDLTVDYNLFARDQFGNLVATTDVSVASTSDVADWDCPDHLADANATCPTLSTNFRHTAPPVAAYNTAGAGHQDLGATWTAPTNIWDDGDFLTPGFQAARSSSTQDLSGPTQALDWYELDTTKGVYSLVPAAKDVEVGTTAKDVLVAVDEFGQPVQGLSVSFTRSGPGKAKSAATLTTNANGKANFTFASSKIGKATVTATVSDGDTVVGSDTNVLRFKYGIKAVLAGSSVTSGGKHYDRLVVSTSPKAAGAVVVFKTAAGKRLGRAKVNSDGVAVLLVSDHKPKRARTYLAIVKPTSTTLTATTNKHKMR